MQFPARYEITGVRGEKTAYMNSAGANPIVPEAGPRRCLGFRRHLASGEFRKTWEATDRQETRLLLNVVAVQTVIGMRGVFPSECL